MPESQPTRLLQPFQEGWRYQAYIIIFEADTFWGKIFDVLLMVAIVLSVTAVALETVPTVEAPARFWLDAAEWVFTVLFTVEYALRMLCVARPGRYARSFFGVVDLVSIVPSYLSLLLPGAEELLVIRGLRLLRVFRVFKLVRYLREAEELKMALFRGRAKITVFVCTVLVVVTIMGAMMHLIEGPEHGFTSIPIGMYWAIVTMSTVGYGDISPQTPLGQALASVLILFGYSLLIVPTGIVSAELIRAQAQAHFARGAIEATGTPTENSETSQDDRVCPGCGAQGHDPDARFCRHCGTELS